MEGSSKDVFCFTHENTQYCLNTTCEQTAWIIAGVFIFLFIFSEGLSIKSVRGVHGVGLLIAKILKHIVSRWNRLVTSPTPSTDEHPLSGHIVLTQPSHD
jgi:hypothetical protein